MPKWSICSNKICYIIIIAAGESEISIEAPYLGDIMSFTCLVDHNQMDKLNRTA